MENENDETNIKQVMDSLDRGSYSFFKPNSSSETMNFLAKECAENRLLWAGEHTSNGASVHTAFATGQREVQKILKYHSNKTLITEKNRM